MKGRAIHTIALFGYYGAGNLGDEAVVSTLLCNIRARMPDARVVGISLNPADTRARHGIRALPIRRMAPAGAGVFVSSRVLAALWRAFAIVILKLPLEICHMLSSLLALRAIDALVVAGSGGVYDWWHGAWTHPFTHFRWALLCHFSRTRMYYVSVGAGPFKTRLGGWFFRHALNWAEYVSVRDRASLECIRTLGVRRPVAVYPDMAFDITPCPDRAEAIAPVRPFGHTTVPTRVGINALPFYHDDWSALQEEGGIGYKAYVAIMAGFTDWLLARGAEPVFFHSQVGDNFLDADIARALDLRRQETAWRTRVRFTDCRTQQELFDEMSALDIIVASRFHALLFSYLLRKPAIGISYHQKVDDLMRGLGQDKYVLDIRRLALPELLAAYGRLEDDVAQRCWRLEDAAFEQNRASLRAQFDHIFSNHTL